MKLEKNYYVFSLSYVGARFFGWQKQRDFPSLHQAFNTALEKALFDTYHKEVPYKSIGASRTDARVNAFDQKVKVKIIGKKLDTEHFKKQVNSVIPYDIHIKDITETTRKMAVIAHAKNKEYLYFFTSNQERSPFLFPYVTYLDEPNLDYEIMKEGVKLFIGTHSFHNYTYRPNTSQMVRTIESLDLYFDYHFDEYGLNIKSHMLKIKGDGFLKQMVRIIMGTLISLGRGDCTLDDIKQSLDPKTRVKLGFIAPPHGLFLYKIYYLDEYSYLNKP